MDIRELLILLNTILTPVSLTLGILVAVYAIRAYQHITKPQSRPVALNLVGIGLLFSIYSIVSIVIYFLPLFFETSIGHELSSLRSLITNILIQAISILMIRIFRDEI